VEYEWLGLGGVGCGCGCVGDVFGEVGGIRERGWGLFFVGVEGDGYGGSEAGVAGGCFASCVSTDFLLGLEESVEVFRRLLK
jgi:hypothetical protein